MRNISRGAAALFAATAATAVLLPTSAATAAPAGDKPEKVKVVKSAPKPRGEIVICNHSGYMFDVYAEGPSIRTDDLAGSFDECTDWNKVLPGTYDIGFSLRVPSQQNVLIQARLKRNGHVFYKVFSGQGQIEAAVGQAQTTRVDLFIPRA